MESPRLKPSLKIDGARFILTVDPERRIIRDGSILVEGQKIVGLGKAAGPGAYRGGPRH